MLVPLGTDRPPKRRPVVNETIIGINLLVYLIGVGGAYLDLFPIENFVRAGHFDPQDVKAWQLVTYQFLHDPYGVGHIIFNMVFLWVFGNAVESRLGRPGYLAFYLVAGCVAALGHAMVAQAPVIGASGSIAGVSGGFLALFPRARIRVLFFLIFIGIIEIPALWLIGFYFLLDFINQFVAFLGRGQSNVAYAAHLAGYVYGFAVCFVLLAIRILKREEFDVFFLFTQARRRAAFRSVQQKSSAVWDTPRAETAEALHERTAKPQTLSAQERDHAERRAEVSRLVANHDMEAALSKYRMLLSFSPGTALPERSQLDLANFAYGDEDFGMAARIYELFLKTYPNSSEADQVRLILAIIYGRRLDDPDRARALAEEVKPRLRDESQRALAEEILAEANGP